MLTRLSDAWDSAIVRKDRAAVADNMAEEFEVRLYGDVALLSGRFDGNPFASHYRYIDIYVRRDGSWRIVSVQIARLPKLSAARKHLAGSESRAPSANGSASRDYRRG